MSTILEMRAEIETAEAVVQGLFANATAAEVVCRGDNWSVELHPDSTVFELAVLMARLPGKPFAIFDDVCTSSSCRLVLVPTVITPAPTGAELIAMLSEPWPMPLPRLRCVEPPV